MNTFDSLQDNMFDTVTSTYGYPASWQPAGGGPLQTAQVLYEENTDKYELSNMNFDPPKWHMEYRTPFFAGLKESVDLNTVETVNIVMRGQPLSFYVRRIIAKYDGQTLVAFLQMKTD